MTLESTALPSGRRLTVYLPPRYDAAAAAPYPLLLLHDGQNLFEGDRAHVPGESWRVGETMDELIEGGQVAPMVVAGIDHGGVERINEMTPTPGGRPGAGGARTYARMVVSDVLPFLRARYHVRTDAAATGLAGASLGGLATLFIAIEHPSVFGTLIVMSPSVWWDNRAILTMMKAGKRTNGETGKRGPGGMATHFRGRIWLDVGLKEGARTVADARRLRDTIRQAWPEAELSYFEDPEGDHSERAWGRRYGRALRWSFR